MDLIPSLLARWQTAKDHIERVSKHSVASGRNITLIAASKGQPSTSIEALLAAGQRVFGENKVQEVQKKWPTLKARYPGMELHLIGALQTNKVKQALALFDVIHTIDRPALIDAIAKEMTGKKSLADSRKFFIQVNTGQEPQKSGVSPRELAALLAYNTSLTNTQLTITGLMCIPPEGENPAPHFALLHQLARQYRLTNLSMGMSADYEIAIRLGATHVRLGTALFGER